jgi:hypothetical protein
MTLHVPYVVKYEFIGQRKSALQQRLNEVKEATRQMYKETNSPEICDYAKQCQDVAQKLKSQLDECLEREFTDWLDWCHAVVHECGADHAQRIAADYFAGAPPFKNPKNRADLPDSFVWHTVIDLQSKFRPLHFVVADNAVCEASVEQGIQASKTLEAFIELPICQSLLRELTENTVGENALRIGRLASYEKEGIAQRMHGELAQTIRAQPVNGGAIPNRTQEATVQEVKQINKVAFDFKHYEYYGDAELGFRFTTTVVCTLTYVVNAATFLRLNFEVGRKSTPGETLDDGFTWVVSEDFELRVDGILSISLDKQAVQSELLEDSELRKLILRSMFSVDILDIGVVGRL